MANFYKTQIIANRGYPFEIHSVTTDDGYILQLHRIPAPKTVGPASNAAKYPVLLMHGLFISSATWILTPSTNSLGKILNDDLF